MPPPSRKKPAAAKSSAHAQNDGAVREILVEAARTQLAAVTAATTFWAGWADMANTYAKNVSDELAKLEAEDGDAGDLLGRITDLTRDYLRELTDLPTASVQHFNAQLETIGKRAGRRTRAARVKP